MEFEKSKTNKPTCIETDPNSPGYKFESYAHTLHQFAMLISSYNFGANYTSMECVIPATTVKKTSTSSQEIEELLSHAPDIVAPLKFCLMHLKDLVQQRTIKHHFDCSRRYELLRHSLTVFFSNTSVHMKHIKKLIAEWMEFLLDILTPPRKRTSEILVVRNTVGMILEGLAVCETCNQFILERIIYKLKCCLSYYLANEMFKSYIVMHLEIIVQLMDVVRKLVQIAIHKKVLSSEVKEELSHVFSVLRECFEGSAHVTRINWQIFNIEKMF